MHDLKRLLKAKVRDDPTPISDQRDNAEASVGDKSGGAEGDSHRVGQYGGPALRVGCEVIGQRLGHIEECGPEEGF